MFLRLSLKILLPKINLWLCKKLKFCFHELDFWKNDFTYFYFALRKKIQQSQLLTWSHNIKSHVFISL